LSVSGATTLNGATTINNTLTATGSTTLGSATGTAGNQITVNSTGVSLVSGGQANGSSVTVGPNGATITGGGSSLVLNGSRGAQFQNASGGPIAITGVANGSSQFDAANFGQVRDLEQLASRGIASVTALANIPQVDTNKLFNIGVGVASFNSETGYAIGASARVAGNGVIKASVGSGSSGKATYGAGFGWSF
jgi:hypothetical protein